jgi:hypothetical protein
MKYGCKLVERDRAVGIAARYGLDGQGIESQWGGNFRVYPDRPWKPPSFLKKCVQGLFPGGEAAGGWG